MGLRFWMYYANGNTTLAKSTWNLFSGAVETPPAGTIKHCIATSGGTVRGRLSSPTQSANPYTSGATLAELEAGVNELKASLRAVKVIASLEYIARLPSDQFWES